MRMTFDFAVIGLGAWGSSVLAEMASRGKRVVGIDQFPVPHTMGSSHGRSRILQYASPEGQFYLPLVHQSRAFFERQAAKTGRSLIRETGAINVASREGDNRSTAFIAAYGGDQDAYEVIATNELRRRLPDFSVLDGEIGIVEHRGAVIDAEAALLANLETAARDGAAMITGTGPVAWTAGRDEVRIDTEGLRLSVGAVALCGGGWSREVFGLDIPFVIERQVVRCYSLPQTAPIVGFPDDTYEEFYGVPEGGSLMKFAAYRGGSLYRRPDEVPREISARDLERIEYGRRQRIRAAKPVSDAKVCLYTNTPDRHFVIGRHPDTERVVLAAGGSGRGFKLSGAVGALVADQLTGKATALPEAFDPLRFIKAAASK